DALIGNAGMLGTLSPLPHLAPAEFEKVLSVNVTANYRLIRPFDLPPRQAEAGRVVFVPSGAAQNARPYWRLDSASKAAPEAMGKSYAAEMASSPVRANAFNPGPVRTAMRAKAMPGEDPETLPSPAAVAPRLVDMVTSGFGDTGQLYDYPSGELRPL